MVNIPLRIIIPGYYGVRHPGWIVEIEVLESGDEDYWTQRGWQTEELMSVDSKIFFPEKGSVFSTLDSIKIGGSAFGGKRILKIEVTLDEGITWFTATVKESLNEDFVWIFWELILSPLPPGIYHIHSRATDANGSTQPWSDNDYLNGTNSLPSVSISVE